MSKAQHKARRSRDRRALWLAALGTALVVGGVSVPLVLDRPVAVEAPPRAAVESTSAAPASELPEYDLAPGAHLEEAAPTPAAEAGPPQRLVIPQLHVDAPVVPIRATGETLFPPDDPQTLGWWSDGAPAGEVWGGTLVTGHTVSRGGGAFDHLETLRVGDPVQVRTPRGVLRYAVTGVEIYRKASLARAAQRVFSQTVPHRLVLVTCEDWDGEKYLSNVVVFADPLEAS